MTQRRRKSRPDSRREGRTDDLRNREDFAYLDPPRGRWRRRVLILAGVAVLLVGIAPNLVGWLGLHRPILHRTLGEFGACIDVQQVSLGWFQPIIATRVAVNDPTGERLLEIESLRTSQTLLGFLWSRHYGAFEIDRPHLNCRMHDDGSNLEDTLALWPDDPESETKPLPLLTVRVTNGRAEFHCAGSAPVVCDSLEATLTIGGAQAALDGELSTHVDCNNQRGQIGIRFTLDPGSAQLASQQAHATVQAEQFPLAALVPVVERWLGPVELGGILSSQVQFEMASPTESWQIACGHCQVAGLQFAAPQWLGNDQIRLQQLQASGTIALEGDRWRAEQWAVMSDVGRLAIDGTVLQDAWRRLASADTLIQTPFRAEGQVNLAQLATVIPGLLRLHADLAFESGDLYFAVANQRDHEQDAQHLAVQLEASNLAAQRGHQRIVWPQPLRVDGRLNRDERGLRLDHVRIDSDFVQLSGRADWRSGHFTAVGDLQQLVDRLGQFVDVSEWQLAGQLSGEFGWRIDAEAATAVSSARAAGAEWPLHVAGKLTIVEPTIGIPQIGIWRDQAIEVTTDSRGVLSGDGAMRLLQSASLIRVGAEQVGLDLRDPVTWGASAPWRFAATGKGSLARWLAHIGAVAPLPPLDIDGELDVVGQLEVSAQGMTLTEAVYRVGQFTFAGYGMRLREEELNGAGAMELDWMRGALYLRDLTGITSTISARVAPMAIQWSPELRWDGRVLFRADVQRLLTWFDVTPAAGSVIYSGQAEGALRLAPAETGTAMHFDVRVPELQAVRWLDGAWELLVQEPNVAVAGRGQWSADWNGFVIEDAQIHAPSVSAVVRGSATELASRCAIDLEGTWRPDWERLAALLAAYSGDGIQLAGREQQSFRIRGPLFGPAGTDSAFAVWPPDDLEAVAELGWQRAEIYRLPLGAGAVTAHLRRGTVAIETGQIDFSGGTVNLAPQIDLRQPEFAAVVGQGRFAKNIVLTPEICRDWIKYFAPILADVTATQGRFSMQTGGATIPLTNPGQTTAQGAILLHDVTVGPGPLGQQLIAAVNQVRALIRAGDPRLASVQANWIRISEQTVPFTIRDGRIYHSNLEFGIQDFSIRTRGSVGFDHSLSLVAEIPIADQWIEGQPFLAFLKGRSLQLPVGGTLSQPRLDEQALQQLLRQLVQPMAANQLQDLLGGQAERMQGRAEEELQRLQEKAENRVSEAFRRGVERLVNPKRDD